MLRQNFLGIMIIILSMIVGCEGSAMNENAQAQSAAIIAKGVKYKKVKEVPESVWGKLSKRRVFFGHQSVGNNILEGVAEVMKNNPQIKLNIVKTKDPGQLKKGALAHASVGKNRDPQSKMDDFSKFIKKGGEKNIDLAFLKFCYVDVSHKTDVKQIFENYNEKLFSLKKEHPTVKFIHFTMPLVSKEGGLRALYKKMKGKSLRDYTINLKREEYNELIRKEYGNKDHIFDLAKIESTFPDGKEAAIVEDGKKISILAYDYTKDGAHLNAVGRKVVAEQFLLYLANMIEKGNL